MFFIVVHFSSLAYKLTTIPTKVVARRMLPRLMSRFVLAEPSAEVNFLPHLLTPMKGITFSQVRLFYPVKFIENEQQKDTVIIWPFLIASNLRQFDRESRPCFAWKVLTNSQTLLLLRSWLNVCWTMFLKPPSFSDDSETDYQLSGLTPVLPDELFRWFRDWLFDEYWKWG